MNIIQGDKKTEKEAWDKLKIYNAGDVETLEALYMKIRSWDSNHPRRSYFSKSEECDVCGSKDLESRGWKKEFLPRSPLLTDDDE